MSLITCLKESLYQWRNYILKLLKARISILNNSENWCAISILKHSFHNLNRFSAAQHAFVWGRRDVILYAVRKQRICSKIGERESVTLGWTQVKGEGKSISLLMYTQLYGHIHRSPDQNCVPKLYHLSPLSMHFTCAFVPNKFSQRSFGRTILVGWLVLLV